MPKDFKAFALVYQPAPDAQPEILEILGFFQVEGHAWAEARRKIGTWVNNAPEPSDPQELVAAFNDVGGPRYSVVRVARPYRNKEA